MRVSTVSTRIILQLLLALPRGERQRHSARNLMEERSRWCQDVAERVVHGPHEQRNSKKMAPHVACVAAKEAQYFRCVCATTKGNLPRGGKAPVSLCMVKKLIKHCSMV